VSTCQEAVDLMVDAIVSACEDAHARTHAHDSAVSGIGKGKGEVVPSVRKEDIVRSVLIFFKHFPSDLPFSLVRRTI